MSWPLTAQQSFGHLAVASPVTVQLQPLGKSKIDFDVALPAQFAAGGAGGANTAHVHLQGANSGLEPALTKQYSRAAPLPRAAPAAAGHPRARTAAVDCKTQSTDSLCIPKDTVLGPIILNKDLTLIYNAQVDTWTGTADLSIDGIGAEFSPVTFSIKDGGLESAAGSIKLGGTPIPSALPVSTSSRSTSRSSPSRRSSSVAA